MKFVMQVITMMVITTLTPMQAQTYGNDCTIPESFEIQTAGQKYQLSVISIDFDTLRQWEGYAYFPYPTWTIRANEEETGRIFCLELAETPYEGTDPFIYSQAYWEDQKEFWFVSTWLSANRHGCLRRRIIFPGFSGWEEGKRQRLKIRFGRPSEKTPRA